MSGERRICSQMSIVFSYHELMDAHVSIDVEGHVMHQIECTKLTDLVVAVSLCEQELVMVV